MRALLQLLIYTTLRHLGPPYETNVLTVHRAWVLLKLVAGPDLNHAVLICMHEACTSFRAVKPSFYQISKKHREVRSLLLDRVTPAGSP